MSYLQGRSHWEGMARSQQSLSSSSLPCSFFYPLHSTSPLVTLNATTDTFILGLNLEALDIFKQYSISSSVPFIISRFTTKLGEKILHSSTVWGPCTPQVWTVLASLSSCIWTWCSIPEAKVCSSRWTVGDDILLNYQGAREWLIRLLSSSQIWFMNWFCLQC